MAARVALANRLARSKAGAIENVNNANVQIQNQAGMYNNQQRYAVDDINARNKGQALSNYYAAIERMGTNNAQIGKDNRAYDMDVKRMQLLPQMYPALAYNPELQSTYSNWYK
jgi:hypothetical protein